MTPGRIKGLGEIALRVRDLDVIQRFYEQVIGLEVLSRFDKAVFFKLADGFGGHTQALALFDRSAQPGYSGLNAATTTIDHIAFEIERADFDAERGRLQKLGLAVETADTLGSIGGRSTSTIPERTQSNWSAIPAQRQPARQVVENTRPAKRKGNKAAKGIARLSL